MGGATTAGSPWPRRLGMLAASPRGAIYGTILATAVIAATAGHEPPGFILAATLAVFWLAHVYADILEHELGQVGFDLKVVPAVMARELSMVAAPALSILFLLLGVLGLLDEGLAVGLALWTGVAQLVGWAIEAGRRHGRSRPAMLLGGVINGAFGVGIIGLEALLH